MFIDELTIQVKAGRGGDGVVRWRHEKGKEFAGPAGGDGGRGGDVYAVAARDLHLLSKYRTKKVFEAKRGQDGMSSSLHGANGEDLEILLPVGSVLTNTETGEKFSLQEEGDRVLLLKGGKGGLGNEHFKGATNRRPKDSTPGKPGQEAEFFIEVELIADIGLVGFPNAGKTSILNELTRAQAKVGNYAFTTLEPNLGECFGRIVADIPGLIEGAAEGRGLGHKFLRHVRRTKVLAHAISFENEDIEEAYRMFRKELEKFDPELLTKEEIIILTKSDLVDVKTAEKIKEEMKQLGKSVVVVTLYDEGSVKILRDTLLKKADEVK